MEKILLIKANTKLISQRIQERCFSVCSSVCSTISTKTFQLTTYWEKLFILPEIERELDEIDLDEILGYRTVAPLHYDDFEGYLRSKRSCNLIRLWNCMLEHELLWLAYCRHKTACELPSSPLRHAELAGSWQPARFSTKNNFNNSFRNSSKNSFKNSFRSSTTASLKSNLKFSLLGKPRASTTKIDPMIDIRVSPRPSEHTIVLMRDIRESASNIHFMFLMVGAPSDVKAPFHIKHPITQHLQTDDPCHPSLFLHLKQFNREQLQLWLSEFIYDRKSQNISKYSTWFQVVISLIMLLVAFTTDISLIFLDYHPYSIRLWSLPCLWLGYLNLISGIARLNPWLVLLKLTESQWLEFVVIESTPILQYQRRQALKLVTVSTMMAILTLLIFLAIPGHRL